MPAKASVAIAMWSKVGSMVCDQHSRSFERCPMGGGVVGGRGGMSFRERIDLARRLVRGARVRAERAVIVLLDEVVSRVAGHRVRTGARSPFERAAEIEAPEDFAPTPSPVPVAVPTPIVASPPPPVEAPEVEAPPLPPPPPKRTRPPARIWTGSGRGGGGGRRDSDRGRPPPAARAAPVPSDSTRTSAPSPVPPATPPVELPAAVKPVPEVTVPSVTTTTSSSPVPSDSPPEIGATPLSTPDRLVLMARDPSFGHAYWEVAPDRIARARADLGEEARGVLRLIDADLEQVLGSVAAIPERGSHVLRFPAGDRAYAVELALESADGQTHTLLRSNTAEAPPNRPRTGGTIVFVDLEPQRALLEGATPRLIVAYP